MLARKESKFARFLAKIEVLICSLALISEKRVCSLARSLPLYKMRFARSFDLLLARLLVILNLTDYLNWVK